MTATLSGGADVVIDCVGSAESIAQSLAIVRPRGTVALVGMPGKVTVDLAPLWHREVRLAGAYAYGTERGGRRRGGRADVRPGPRVGGGAAAPAGSCPPPTRSPASRRRWPTPAPPAGGAPSRSRSTYGKDRPDEPPTRLRPRGGQVAPPTLFWNGEGFTLETLPEGSRVIYAPEPIEAHRGPVPCHPRRPAPPRRRPRPAAGAARGRA